MKAYIAHLERLRLQESQMQTESKDSTRVPTPTLDQQITTLMQSLPPTVRDRQWVIQDMVNRLKGINNERPHSQGVGQALQRLGWKRIRPATMKA